MRSTILAALALAACGAPTAPVTSLKFAAKADAQIFACGTPLMLGSPATSYSPKDFRYYVTDVKLVLADGSTVPFALTNDGAYQDDDTALLDFEDGTGDCTDGTASTHTTLTGTAPGENVTGVQFTLGLPFAKNHGDASVAAAPLDSSAMFWSWQMGYRFLKLEGGTSGVDNWLMHLGSTGCEAGSTPNSVSSCAKPNMVTVKLDGFDPATSVITFDIAKLFANTDLSKNIDGAPGCMSGDTDSDCGDIFTKLGLPDGTQSVFTLEN